MLMILYELVLNSSGPVNGLIVVRLNRLRPDYPSTNSNKFGTADGHIFDSDTQESKIENSVGM